jgi:hypothetical protein
VNKIAAEALKNKGIFHKEEQKDFFGPVKKLGTGKT